MACFSSLSKKSATLQPTNGCQAFFFLGGGVVFLLSTCRFTTGFWFDPDDLKSELQFYSDPKENTHTVRSVVLPFGLARYVYIWRCILCFFVAFKSRTASMIATDVASQTCRLMQIAWTDVEQLFGRTTCCSAFFEEPHAWSMCISIIDQWCSTIENHKTCSNVYIYIYIYICNIYRLETYFLNVSLCFISNKEWCFF